MPFKSVVVMHQRGVLVAIAGRRDGVRVYALDEVRRAIDWRIDTEIRREKDKIRREEAKKAAVSDLGFGFVETKRYPEKTPPITPATPTRTKSLRRASSSGSVFMKKHRSPAPPVPPIPSLPNIEDPPTYQLAQSRDRLEHRMSAHQLVQRTPAEPAILSPVTHITSPGAGDDVKAEWSSRTSSDDEAIDIVAAGTSGSQALDERTSAISAASSTQPSIPLPSNTPSISRSTNRRSRPANLDLSSTRMESGSTVVQQPPSPTPTLTAIRQTLRSHPSTLSQGTVGSNTAADHDGDEDDEEGPSTPTDHITLAQALLESRIPGLPPAGTRQPQQAILINARQPVDDPPRPPASESMSQRSGRSNNAWRLRRWSVMDMFYGARPSGDAGAIPPSLPPTPTSRPRTLSRSQSGRVPTSLPSRSGSPAIQPPTPTRSTPNLVQNLQVTTPPRTRFLPRILSGAFSGRRGSAHSSSSDVEKTRVTATPAQTHSPPPKLEYVKLPGTKGAVLIKAVETAKKRYPFLSVHGNFDRRLISSIASLRFSAENVVRRLSFSLVHIALPWACPGPSSSRIRHGH